MIELIEAVKQYDIPQIQKLCENGADPNIADEKGLRPLHYAVLHRNKTAIKTLIQNGADISGRTKIGNTALHLAADKNDTDIIDVLIKCGAKIDERNDMGKAPIHIATLFNCEDAILALQKAGSKIDIDAFVLRRVLFNVFNQHSLTPLLEQYDSVKLERGGYFQEAATTIKEMLTLFATKKSKERELTPLIEAIDALCFSANNSDGEINIIRTGCDGHSIYASFKEKNPLNTSLVLAERGLFALRDKNSKKYKSLWSISVPSQYANIVRKKLLHAHDVEEDDAREILFKRIPELLQTEYKYLNVQQKAFKNGHCFFENLKSSVLAEFIDLYGVKEGKILYKEFDIFMHQKALLRYMNKTNDSNRYKIDKLCREIIKTKQKKLQELKKSLSTDHEEHLHTSVPRCA